MTSDRRSSFWEHERAFTRHYLGVDGPEGSSPLEYVDASPRRLASALGRPASEADDAVKAFLAIFDRQDLVDAFSFGVGRHPPRGSGTMGYFNHLVLSCYVASVAPDVSEAGQYPRRLQDLLGLKQGISSLSGLAILWERAAAWCEKRHREIGDVRLVALPDPGTMTRIGYSMRIVFPSRHDLGRMQRLFSTFATGPLPTSRDVVSRVRRELTSYPWSQGFLRAFDDFDRRRRNGERLLADHPFWLGLVGLRTSDTDTPTESDFALDVSTDFDGSNAFAIWTDHAGLLRDLGFERTDATTSDPVAVDVSLAQTLAVLARRGPPVPRSLSECHSEGLVPFVEVRWGVWRAVRDPGDVVVRLLVREDVLNGRIVGGRSDWKLLPPRPASEAAMLLTSVRRHSPLAPTDVRRVRLIGGVRVGHGYLGRPDFLPSIEAIEACSAETVAVGSTTGALTAVVAGSSIRLTCVEPIEGVWRIPVEEAGATRSSPTVIFEAEATARAIAPVDVAGSGWGRDEVEPHGCSVALVSPADGVGTEPSERQPLLDLLEAIYAGGASGWSEARLIPLIGTVSPVAGAAWDVLRLLSDAGWLEARSSRTWRARKWFLVPPALASYETRGPVLLEGAAPEALRRRFREAAIAAGGRVEVRALASTWSVPCLAAYVTDREDFALTLGLPLAEASAFVPKWESRLAFPASHYDAARRLVASRWSWRRGRFVGSDVDEAELVSLERLVTPIPNAADVYRVSKADRPSLLLDGRSAAILTAHLWAGRPLLHFHVTSRFVDRSTHDGGLPSGISRYLKLRARCGPAIVFEHDGSWRYRWPCELSDARRLVSTLQEAFDAGTSETGGYDPLRAMALARVRGPAGMVVGGRLWKGA